MIVIIDRINEAEMGRFEAYTEAEGMLEMLEAEDRRDGSFIYNRYEITND